jgi:hypothetical protein
MPIRSQHDQRKAVKYKDQHGRPWSAWIELRTGDPCTIISPKGWTAPVMPPQNYLKLDPEVPGKLDIQYDQWEKDLVKDDRDWYRRGNEYGIQRFGEQHDADSPFNATILDKIGARPRVPKTVTPFHLPAGAAALPVQAAKSGNLWALGLKGPNGETPKMPEKLAAFYTVSTTESPTFENEFEGAEAFEPEQEHEPLPDFLRAATTARSA